MCNYHCIECDDEFNGSPEFELLVNEFLDNIPDSHNSILENERRREYQDFLPSFTDFKETMALSFCSLKCLSNFLLLLDRYKEWRRKNYPDLYRSL